MDYLAFILFIIVALAGLFSNILGFPGNFVILSSSLFYGWYGDFQEITLKVLIIVLVLAILGEISEFVAGVAGSRKHRSSSKAMIGSIIGGMIGAMIGVPFFLGMGAILGAFIGAFLGAFIVESVNNKGFNQAIKSGWGALVGRVAGTIIKGMIGVVMIVITIGSVIKN